MKGICMICGEPTFPSQNEIHPNANRCIEALVKRLDNMENRLTNLEDVR